MESATIRFFDLPELVSHLIQYLNCRDISRLLQTSQRLNTLCTPAHYYSVSVDFEHTKLNNLFSSTESTQALARNIDRVRNLYIARLDTVFYTNGTIAFHDLPSVQQTAIIALERQLALLQPPWLAPPDLQSCTVVPIPPMTLLTRLKVNLVEQDKFEMCPYYLPSYRDPKAILTQVCWIIQSNPHLQYVQIDRAPIKDDRDARLLITSIFGLRKLQTLNVDIAYWRGLTDSPMNRVRSDVFFACPPTLQSIRLSSHQRYLSDNNVILEDYIQLPPGTPQTWEKSDEECGLLTTTTTALPRRQEPLLDLKDLSLGSSAEDITDFELLLILQHCPNLTTLKAPSLPEVYDVQDMAQKTAQYCPKLSDLSTIGTSEQNFSVQKSMVLMLQTLPEQQVTRIQCTGSLEWYLQGLSNAGSIFRRHSSTLRKIFITGCRNLDSKVIQAIVVGCEALEQLNVTWAMESNGQRRLCIDLDDAVEFPWACTKLQELTLTIAIPDHPFHLVTEGVAPYYERPPPTAFSAGEKQQLKSLETLYRQIGALTNMRKLDLRAEFYDPEGRRPLTRDYKRTTFPGMLSLGCERTGRPGFLRLLAGLTQLGLLLGTVTADTKETKVTIGTRELEWMRKHWPVLSNPPFLSQ